MWFAMATSATTEPRALAPTYLEQGLVALGGAGRVRWFDGLARLWQV